MAERICFSRLREDAVVPSKRPEDAGYDIYACLETDFIKLEPLETRLIPTGIASACSPGYYFQLFERGSTGTRGIAQRCGVVNLSAEGQVYIGALCAVLAGTELDLPMALHIPVTLLAAFLGGALFGTLPAIMKNRFGASELITTIMFNYVALYFVHYMIAGPIKDLNSGSNFAQSKQMLESAQLPRLLAGTRLHAGLIVAVAALVFYQFFLFHTTRGYEMRVIGLNRTAGECAGMNTKTNTLLSMFLAGGFAGLGGACELMGVQLRIMENAFNGFGFDGVAVALLGGNAAGGIALSSLLFGALKSGATKMQMKSGVPTATIYMLQGLIILFVVGKRLFDYHRLHKKSRKHAVKEGV